MFSLLVELDYFVSATQSIAVMVIIPKKSMETPCSEQILIDKNYNHVSGSL